MPDAGRERLQPFRARKRTLGRHRSFDGMDVVMVGADVIRLLREHGLEH